MKMYLPLTMEYASIMAFDGLRGDLVRREPGYGRLICYQNIVEAMSIARKIFFDEPDKSRRKEMAVLEIDVDDNLLLDLQLANPAARKSTQEQVGDQSAKGWTDDREINFALDGKVYLSIGAQCKFSNLRPRSVEEVETARVVYRVIVVPETKCKHQPDGKRGFESPFGGGTVS